MKVPLLDLQPQLETIKDEIKSAVLEVLDTTQYVMGPKIEELEARIAEYCGAPSAIAVSSGTDALLVALMALDAGPNHIVITTPFSFFATAGAIARVHATPAFVDIDPDTYNLDPAMLRAWLRIDTERAKRVKAIIPVHLYGQCADMDPILEVANEFSVPVIEDAAQAIGSTYPTGGALKKAGSMGLLGCFSFYPTKNLGSIGDGGMVVTNDAAVDEKIRTLRNHGAERRYYHSLIGGNFRLDVVQAVVLIKKLKHLDGWNAARRKIAAYYNQHLRIDGVQTPQAVYGPEHHVYNQYVIRVPDRRDELRRHLSANHVGNEVFYPVPFHEQECFKHLGYKTGDFPNAEHAARHTLAIPIYPELTTDMQDYVIEQLNAFYA